MSLRKVKVRLPKDLRHTRLNHEIMAVKAELTQLIFVIVDGMSIHQLAGEISLVSRGLQPSRQPLSIVAFLDELGITT